jgi:hypothetical protein
MSHELSGQTKRPTGAERPFPWRCHHCGKDEVILSCIRYETEIDVGGRTCGVTIPDLEIPVCRSCGQKVFTEKVDAQINSAIRKHGHQPIKTTR